GCGGGGAVRVRGEGRPARAGLEPEPALAAAGSRPGRGTGLGAEPEPSRWESGSYRRIAVAVELAEADDNVVHFLRRAQLASEAQLVFVHVAESAASRWLGEPGLGSERRGDAAAPRALSRGVDP